VSDDVTVVKNLLPVEVYKDLVDYLDNEVKYLPLSVDTDQFVRTYAHNPPYLVQLHRQLAEFASEMFGIKLIPSYVFLSMYENDGICPLHIDRDQCFRTIDLLVRTTSTDPWPIRIGQYLTDDERTALQEAGAGHPTTPEDIQAVVDRQTWSDVVLEPNDAVLYSGTHQWHYRPHRLVGTADLVFFHFVPEGFNGPLS
jgi:hypothetical protein